ncbi:MAG: glycosyltransferase family 2 protein [Deltaproteobacteria bacterium]|nr:glycosyltransferase family 2 protein [Deltaproteobacteria bacterium]
MDGEIVISEPTSRINRMSEKPLVSVIIVNWNGRQYLDDCLSSLRNQSLGDFEVILVDNGSTDDSVAFVEQHYQDFVQIVRLSENRGFSGGNNAGIATARGVYIALLNNDTVVDQEWLSSLVHCIHSDESIGMVGSKILNYYRREEIDNTGHLIYPDGLNRGRGRLEIDHNQYDMKTDILFPSGCAALYKKQMIEETGGFDESFFAYGDDADIGLHGRYLGYNAIYCPKAVVFHKYSGTAGMYSALKAFHVERNRIWILVKYFPVEAIIVSPFFTLARLLLQLYGALTGKGAAGKFAKNEPSTLIMKTFIKAYASAIKGMPDMLEKRKTVHQNRRISPRAFKTLLKMHRMSCREIALKE